MPLPHVFFFFRFGSSPKGLGPKHHRLDTMPGGNARDQEVFSLRCNMQSLALAMGLTDLPGGFNGKSYYINQRDQNRS